MEGCFDILKKKEIKTLLVCRAAYQHQSSDNMFSHTYSFDSSLSDLNQVLDEGLESKRSHQQRKSTQPLSNVASADPTESSPTSAKRSWSWHHLPARIWI